MSNSEWVERQRAERNKANLLELKRKAVGLSPSERDELASIPIIPGLDEPPNTPGGFVVLPRQCADEAEFEARVAKAEAARARESKP